MNKDVTAKPKEKPRSYGDELRDRKGTVTTFDDLLELLATLDDEAQ